MSFDIKSFIPGLLIGITLAFGLNNLNASNNTNLKSEVIKIYNEDTLVSKEYKIQQIFSKIEAKEFVNTDTYLTEEEQKNIFKDTLITKMKDCNEFANYVSERTDSLSTYDLNVLRLYDIAYPKICERVE